MRAGAGGGDDAIDGGEDGIGGRADGGIGAGGASDTTGAGTTGATAFGAFALEDAFAGAAAFFDAPEAERRATGRAAGRSTGSAELFADFCAAFAGVFTAGAARRAAAGVGWGRLCISFAGEAGRAGRPAGQHVRGRAVA